MTKNEFRPENAAGQRESHGRGRCRENATNRNRQLVNFACDRATFATPDSHLHAATLQGRFKLISSTSSLDYLITVGFSIGMALMPK